MRSECDVSGSMSAQTVVLDLTFYSFTPFAMGFYL